MKITTTATKTKTKIATFLIFCGIVIGSAAVVTAAINISKSKVVVNKSVKKIVTYFNQSKLDDILLGSSLFYKSRPNIYVYNYYPYFYPDFPVNYKFFSFKWEARRKLYQVRIMTLEELKKTFGNKLIR